ncbi:sensor domain-containing protein [Mycobacteroides chelonae]|nr:sensor domain-containing protein [[Mycobacterium] chelonae subsp. gwanakae]OHU17213.1 sensor domain-containing protein [Mycobacteroides chelonae]
MDPAVKGIVVTSRSVYRKTAVAVCAAVVLTGCSIFGGGQHPATSGPPTTSGASKTSTTSAADAISPDRANSIIVSKKDVSELVGSTLEYEGKSSNPRSSSPIDGKQSCQALMVPLTVDVGDKWTTYRDVWYREGKDTFTHSVTQRVLLYSSKDDARENYSKEFPADVRSCSGEELKVDTATWRVSVREASDDRAQWVLDEIADGRPSGWRCMLEARIIENLLLSATVCQVANGGPALRAIVDRMVAATQPK